MDAFAKKKSLFASLYVQANYMCNMSEGSM